MNKRPQMKAMWIEHNKKEFGSRIVALENIIRSQVKATGKSDQFTSDMLVAIKSGRKITPKMEKAINNIIHRNKPEEMPKRVDWVQSVVPKIVMVTNLINETDWSDLYKSSKVYFLESVTKQAKKNMRLSQKQMDCVTKIYKQATKNIKKKKNKS